MYGAQNARTNVDIPSYDSASPIGKNSEVFNKGDIVTVASGFVKVSGVNDRPYGIIDLTATMSSTNQTVAKQRPPIVPNTSDLTFEMDLNADGAEADNGSFFQLTGTTGAMLVDYSSKSATVGPVVLVKLDPRGEGSVRRGLFRFAKGLQSYTVA